MSGTGTDSELTAVPAPGGPATATPGAAGAGTERSVPLSGQPNGAESETAPNHERGAKRSLGGLWVRYGPYLVATLLLALGFLHYFEGAFYSLSDRFYRNWAFPEFRYSDLIWLYLRDNLDQQPVPYLDYPLEYPPLTGLVTYLISFLPSLPAYYVVAYLLLALSALGTIWALRQLPGANPWHFAVAPALFFYTGHQWDGIAIFVTALSLVAIVRGRENWGTLGLAAGVSLKLFPVVFIAALVIDRLRRRQYRAALEIVAIAGFTTLVINLPLALANLENWSWFIRWNRDRLADAGIWVLWRGLPTPETTTYSLVAVAVGGLVITALALRAKGPLVLPLGATYLLWWMLANKTFTTHLVLWVFFAVAVLGVSWWLWGALVATDLIGFQIGNFINLYNVADFQHTPLIQKAVLYIYDPLQVVRSAILLVTVAWGIRAMWRSQPSLSPDPAAAPPPNGPVPNQAEAALAGTSPNGPAHPVKPDVRTLAARVRPRWSLSAIGVWLAVLTAFTGATVAMTWPYALHLADSTVVGFDPLLQIWLSQWIQHALATNPLALYQANIFHPFALTLAYTDANVPGALLAWPLDLLTRDPILTNSLLVLASFVLAAAGMYALVTEITRNRAAGLIAGLAYAFLPYRMVHLWHLNWLQSAWLPWIAWLTVRLIQRPTPGRTILLGVLIAVQTLTSFYFALQIAILVGALLIAALIARPRLRTRSFLSTVAIAAGVAALLTIPLYLPYLQVRADQGLERTLSDSEHYKATAVSYLQIAPWAEPVWDWLGQRPGPNEALAQVGQAEHADGHQHREIVIEDALFPGLLATIGAVAGVIGWRRRRWLAVALAAIAVIAVVLSLGPSWGPRDGTGFPLPYRFLYEHVPFFRAMRVPARLGGLASLAVVALFGLGVAAGWRLIAPRLRSVAWRRVAAIGGTTLLSLLVLFELYAAPIPLAAVDRGPEQAAPYEWLAAQPEGVVMEFPAESIFADPAASSVRRHVGLTMFWSTKHWLPLVNGSSGFIPEAYSDYIEAFVGQIPRPDGSLTGRISHVSPETVGLLRELDVRYLVFHRSRYQEADLPAVEGQLAEAEGMIEKVGDFGDAAIYELQPTVRRSPRPKVTLWSPTLLADEMPWAPLVTVENPAEVPVVLSHTEPATFHVTWYDGRGRELWRGEEEMPLPTVLSSEQILCTIEECEPANGPFPDDLPDPEAAFWRPEEQGHYYVRLVLDGNQRLSCLVDLDVTADLDHALEISPKSPFRWGECIPGERNPINAPGEVPFRSGVPSITFIGGTAAVQVPLITRDDEEVRGWFLLAPPGSRTPWTEPVYQSPMQQRLVRASEQVEFDWLAEIGGRVPTGVYGLTIWFHQREGTEWSHAYGGTYQLAPVVVENGAARWAGPVRITLPRQSLRFTTGRTTRLRFDVSGTSSKVDCDGEWRLVAPADRTVVAGGHVADCDRPAIAVPHSVEPGRYRLEIDVNAIRDERVSLSDGFSTVISVTERERSGEPR